MAIIHATEKNFNDVISSGIVIVDFFATWCGPCKMLGPVIEQLANKYENISFVKVDVDECPNISKQYGIMSVPTLLKLKDGNILEQKIGYLNINEFEKWLN